MKFRAIYRNFSILAIVSGCTIAGWCQKIVTGQDVNAGTAKVLACGYDAQGIWRTIPLLVQYHFDGAQYKALVLNAWNPWTDSWNHNVDQPAYNTSYFLRGNTYDFYTNLSTGTYYFNL